MPSEARVSSVRSNFDRERKLEMEQEEKAEMDEDVDEEEEEVDVVDDCVVDACDRDLP